MGLDANETTILTKLQSFFFLLLLWPTADSRIGGADVRLCLSDWGQVYFRFTQICSALLRFAQTGSTTSTFSNTLSATLSRLYWSDLVRSGICHPACEIHHCARFSAKSRLHLACVQQKSEMEDRRWNGNGGYMH